MSFGLSLMLKPCQLEGKVRLKSIIYHTILVLYK